MRKVFMCKEMEKLRKKLDDMNIPWEDKSTICSDEHIALQTQFGIDPEYADTTVFRTHFWYNGEFFSVINGWATYGGYDPDNDVNEGLLEVMQTNKNTKKEDIMGCLTADGVISLMKGF